MGAYDNSVDKELHLRFMQQNGTINGVPTYGLYELVENDRIVAESMALTMGVLEATQFELGSYVLPEMTITLLYNGNRYKNKIVRAWINEVGETAIHGLFCGEVYKETLSDDRQTVTLTMRNLLYGAFSACIDWNEMAFPETEEQEEGYYTIRNNVRNIFKHLIQYTFAYACKVFDTDDFDEIISDFDAGLRVGDICSEYADFTPNTMPRLGVITELAKCHKDENVSVEIGTVWKWFGEFCGLHWAIDKPNYSTMADITANTIQIEKDIDILPIRFDELEVLVPQTTLYPNTNLYPMFTAEPQSQVRMLPYYISAKYDEFVKTKYEWAVYDSYEAPIGTSVIKSMPYYFASKNMLFDFAFLDTGTGNPEPQSAAWMAHINNLKGKYNPTNSFKNYMLNLDKIFYAIIDSQYDISMKLGDSISLTVWDDTTIVIPVMCYQVSGTNNLIATYNTTAIQES